MMPRTAPYEGAIRTIELRVVPRAERNEVGGERNGRLLVRVTAPPVDGKANAAVIKALASHLGVPKSRIEIISGGFGRDKTVAVRAD